MLIFTVMCFALVMGSEAKKITASNGGIGRVGEEMMLTLENDEDWGKNTCWWFFKGDYCQYKWNETLGMGQLDSCTSDELKKALEYTGSVQDVCGISIKNLTEAFNGTWQARMASDANSLGVDVIVAKPVDSVSIMVNNNTEGKGVVLADQESQIVCTVLGGRPIPKLNLAIKGFNASKVVSNSQVQTPDEDGVYTTVETWTVKPRIEDFNRSVSCQAVLFDSNDKPLFDVVKAEKVYLDVQFVPQGSANLSIVGNEKGNVTINFKIKANPKPNEVKWMYTQREDSKDSITEIKKGDAKYNIFNMTDLGNLMHEVKMQILDLKLQDQNLTYRVDVKNDVGTQSYFAQLVVKEVKDDSNGGSSKKGTIFGILTAVLLVAIIIGSIFIYKKKKGANTTVPMTNLQT